MVCGCQVAGRGVVDLSEEKQAQDQMIDQSQRNRRDRGPDSNAKLARNIPLLMPVLARGVDLVVADAIRRHTSTLYLGEHYGLFANMTEQRPSLCVFLSYDGGRSGSV